MVLGVQEMTQPVANMSVQSQQVRSLQMRRNVFSYSLATEQSNIMDFTMASLPRRKVAELIALHAADM